MRRLVPPALAVPAEKPSSRSNGPMEGRPSIARPDVDALDARMQELFDALRAWRRAVKGDGPLMQAWDAYEAALEAVVDRDELEAALVDQAARPGETIPPSRP